jgi:hypothetical protein
MRPRELKLLAEMNNSTPEEYVADAAISTLELLKAFAEGNGEDGFTMINHEGSTLVVFDNKFKHALGKHLMEGSLDDKG